jgi:CRP/FNR family transcriptional regulator, cyclic AMP receptor protein
MADLKESPVQRRVADKRAILREHFLFGRLSPHHLDRLSACIVTKSVKRGTSIFSKGDPGSSMLAIAKGTVRISVPVADGHDVVFNLLGKGEIFGEIALLDGRTRTADAIAVTDCELFVIERRDFLPLVREDSEIALELIEVLCLRLRRQSTQAEDVMFHNLPSRLAKALLRLADVGAGAAPAPQRKVTITQRDLGNMIGMSRESTNKQLRIWEKCKWVRLDRGVIEIVSSSNLAEIAEDDCYDD